MEDAIKANNQKAIRKKNLFYLYLALGCNTGACLSYIFYRDITLIFLISSILIILQLLRDQIFDSA